jgi:3-isopropylmalate dehydrogenase
MLYSEPEIRRIAEVGFQAALKRGKKLCSVDKENVLETSRFWREVVGDVGKQHPQVQLSHMYVDNAAMQLVRNPKHFDVVVTGNMFGDILSDEASMLTGSMACCPRHRSTNAARAVRTGIWFGSDIAGRNLANPLATICRQP